MISMKRIEPIMLRHLLDYIGDNDSISIVIDNREFLWNKYANSGVLKATTSEDGMVTYFTVEEMEDIEECLSGNEISFTYDGFTHNLSFMEKKNINSLMNSMLQNA